MLSEDMFFIEPFFYVDNLSLVMMGLMSFVVICVISFSTRYLDGDRRKIPFFYTLVLLVISVFLMVVADHILIFWISLMLSDFFLTRLILYKKEWNSARESSFLALKNFALCGVFLGAALMILYSLTGETSIQAIINKQIDSVGVIISSVLILLAAMTQSAIWPFYRWLISSLNSPTPVSAIMHAGLINGGGFLLSRFVPLLVEEPMILNLIFIFGVITSLLGTLWTLMQNDIKRTLACSTIGQMGFMFVQCGLGLFPAAITHLCWHGLFKAHLFLSSGAAAHDRHVHLESPTVKDFFQALICGILGAYIFSIVGNREILLGSTTVFLVLIALVAGTQFALPIISSKSIIKVPIALIITTLMGGLYGLSVRLIEWLLQPVDIMVPQPLNSLHIFALVLLVIGWIFVLFIDKQKNYPEWLLKIYVYMFNVSQPHPKTITTHRNFYRY